ncbi:hypothetical protein [Winogradskyella sp. 3972H.M.0a.05]|uniref:hypothetical protein n=1 Tax=Winogradskyella sp. 3972H.M.0a.05 TaxID=2950277 RepID=UPI003392E8E8
MRAIKFFITITSLLIVNGLNAQAGIGTQTPQAALDIVSSSAGILIPRMSTAERDAVSADLSELIYNTDTNQFEYYSDGNIWIPIGGSGSGSADGNGLYDGNGSLIGPTTVTQAANNLAFTSTSGSLSFTTTSGNIDFDSNTLFIDGANDRVGIGNNNPSQALDVNGNVEFSGELLPGGAVGSSGQVLISGGSGSTPSWQTAPSIKFNTGNYVEITDADYTVNVDDVVLRMNDLTTTRTVTLPASGAYIGDFIIINVSANSVAAINLINVVDLDKTLGPNQIFPAVSTKIIWTGTEWWALGI